MYECVRVQYVLVWVCLPTAFADASGVLIAIVAADPNILGGPPVHFGGVPLVPMCNVQVQIQPI